MTSVLASPVSIGFNISTVGNVYLYVHISAPFSVCITLVHVLKQVIICHLSPVLSHCLKKKKSTGGNYDSRFDVGKASGTLIIARPLDAEQKSNYNLTVEATDGTRTVSTQVIETLMKWLETDGAVVTVMFFLCEE